MKHAFCQGQYIRLTATAKRQGKKLNQDDLRGFCCGNCYREIKKEEQQHNKARATK